jgi:hypothetical protein
MRPRFSFVDMNSLIRLTMALQSLGFNPMGAYNWMYDSAAARQSP